MGQTGFKPTIDLKQFDALAADGDLSRGGQQVEIGAGNQSDTWSGKMDVRDHALAPGRPDHRPQIIGMMIGKYKYTQCFHIVELLGAFPGRHGGTVLPPANDGFVGHDIVHETIPVHGCVGHIIRIETDDGGTFFTAHSVNQIGHRVIGNAAQQM